MNIPRPFMETTQIETELQWLMMWAFHLNPMTSEQVSVQINGLEKFRKLNLAVLLQQNDSYHISPRKNQNNTKSSSFEHFSSNLRPRRIIRLNQWCRRARETWINRSTQRYLLHNCPKEFKYLQKRYLQVFMKSILLYMWVLGEDFN